MKFNLDNETTLTDFHYLVSGASGTGKTSLLLMMILEIALEQYKNKKWRYDAYKNILIVDPKKSSLYSLRHCFPKDGIDNVVYDAEGAIKLLQRANDQIEIRGALFDNEYVSMYANFTDLGLAPFYIIVDEVLDLISTAKSEKLDKEINRLLLSLITRGRQCGVFCVLGIIRSDTTFLSGAIRSTMTKILLADQGREPDADGTRMLFGTAKLPKKQANMRYWFYMMGETGTPTLHLTPHLDEKVDVRKTLKKLLSYFTYAPARTVVPVTITYDGEII
ncbi:hypothetical protein GYN67_09040 [Lactococcus piscium]|uniref:hypothetical protein n=1 Tax=Pseudolactococcus carnosus TaxID=2749961 RepID=UPI001FBB7B3C|nr:hypothetical protein [Lactococcus carnosus]MCJ1996834.1 hypothetical protein [Lactococcus carnosus]